MRSEQGHQEREADEHDRAPRGGFEINKYSSIFTKKTNDFVPT